MTDKLKSCPFCGGKAEWWDTFDEIFPYQIVCKSCYCGTDAMATKHGVIERWNTRKPMDRIVEQLEEASYDSMHLDMSRPMTETWQIVDLDDAIAIVKGGEEY